MTITSKVIAELFQPIEHGRHRGTYPTRSKGKPMDLGNAAPDQCRVQPVIRVILWLLAAVSAVNAVWMLAHAWSWFRWIPGVTDTGVANAHFIHDVGIVYLLCAGGLLWCTRRPERGYPLFIGIALFFIGHALGHVAEILAGQLPISHWLIDLPLVFAPAVLLAVLACPPVWRRVAPSGRA